MQHELPSLKCSEEECIADFVIRKKTRLEYPGACSLEFQSVMQILTNCLLKWDTQKRKSTGQGILGTVLAFFGADEEQGRKTLHRHWQIWTKEMNQTLRNSLFDNDPNKRKEARITFTKLVDSFICAGYGLGCIFLPESSGFLYFPFRTPVFDRNLNFRSAVTLFFGIKRSKNLRSKTKAMGQDHGVPRVPSGTVLHLLRLAIVKSQAATLVLLHA